MSADTIDCSDLAAIARAFMPDNEKARQGLESAIRMYGRHRFIEGQKWAFNTAVSVMCKPEGALAGIRDLIEAAKTGLLPMSKGD